MGEETGSVVKKDCYVEGVKEDVKNIAIFDQCLALSQKRYKVEA